jgi:hypothetical protein
MRSPSEMDIIQLDISNKCMYRCSNCTRLLAHAPKTWEMSTDQFVAGVETLQDWYKPGKVAGIIAGEPTLNTNFEEIALAFADNFGGPLTTHGRQPIADYNAFAIERLHDRSNGRGLWTAFGPGFYKHYEVIQDVFSHWNPNDHTAGGQHQALLIDRATYCKETGTSDDDWLRARDSCWVQNLWSATINDKGAYPCEVMAAIDRLYYDGAHAWPVESGWWKRTPAEFGSMLDLCNHCALAQKGPSQLDTLDRDIISAPELENLKRIGSPAVKKGQYDLYQLEVHDQKRQVTTKDSYAGDWRVGPENRSMFPKKLTLVVVCVGREEQFAKTINRNIKLVDEMVVVTTPDDPLLKWIPRAHPKIRVVTSSRCYENNDAFNKGKMLNDGIAAIDKPDWILLSDADVFLNPDTLKYIKSHALNPGVLYGAPRVDLQTEAEVKLYQKLGMMPARPQHPLDEHVANGYFQLFHPRAFAIRDKFPKALSENFCSAGGVDSCFMQQWPREKLCVIPELAVAHIRHGELGSGWNGKAMANLPCGRWEQVGMMTPSDGIVFGSFPAQPARMRFTETLTGMSIEVPAGAAPPVHRTKDRESIIFNGRNIGQHHVHVAVWRE